MRGFVAILLLVDKKNFLRVKILSVVDRKVECSPKVDLGKCFFDFFFFF